MTFTTAMRMKRDYSFLEFSHRQTLFVRMSLTSYICSLEPSYDGDLFSVECFSGLEFSYWYGHWIWGCSIVATICQFWLWKRYCYQRNNVVSGRTIKNTIDALISSCIKDNLTGISNDYDGDNAAANSITKTVSAKGMTCSGLIQKWRKDTHCFFFFF